MIFADPPVAADKIWRVTFPTTLGFLSLVVLVLGLGVWGTQTRLSGAIVASGVIEVQPNRQVIQHPDGGVVAETLVRNGDEVKAGQVLVQFDETYLRSELKVVETQIYDFLARKARLKAEHDEDSHINFPDELTEIAYENSDIQSRIEGQNHLFFAHQQTISVERRQLEEQSAQFEKAIRGARIQLESLGRQLELIAQDLGIQQKLFSNGLTPANRIKTLQREAARVEGEVGRLEAEIDHLKGQISGTGIEITRLATSRREDVLIRLREISFKEIELVERRNVLHEQLSRLAVRAPVAGQIYDSKVFAVNSVIQPAAAMMYVVPLGAPLLIVSRIEAVHIDQVFIGQGVTLRFPAFNQRQTPEIPGKVVNISADSFTDKVTGLRYYRAELVPETREFNRLSDQVLLPGMPVEVFVKTDGRTPLSYIIKPFTDYFNKAFRG